MASKEAITAHITLLEENYTHKEKMTTAMVKLWCEMLADISEEDLDMAVKHHMRTSKWFPSIAELADASFVKLTHNFPTALESYQEVQREIRRVGHLGTPEFENPLTQICVDSFGWKYLCMSENMMADRAHYLKAYEQIATREKATVRMLPEMQEALEGASNKLLGEGNEKT